MFNCKICNSSITNSVYLCCDNTFCSEYCRNIYIINNENYNKLISYSYPFNNLNVMKKSNSYNKEINITINNKDKNENYNKTDLNEDINEVINENLNENKNTYQNYKIFYILYKIYIYYIKYNTIYNLSSLTVN